MWDRLLAGPLGKKPGEEVTAREALATVAGTLVAGAVLVGVIAAVLVADPFKTDPCPGGVAQPVSIDRAISALRAHGFSVARDPSACAGAADVLMMLNNSADDDALNREGHVICAVQVRPRAKAAQR